MLSTHPADYNQLQTELDTAGLELSAAEVHGLICGTICNQMKTGARPDLRQLLTAGLEVGEEVLASLRVLLENMLTEIVRSLYGNLGEFRLLLPDENEQLSLRVQALADWCQGFMVGLLSNEAFAIDQLSPDSAEAARDIMTISEVDACRKDEGDEWDFAEVEEFVRVGVQLIFEELRSAQNSNVSGEIH